MRAVRRAVGGLLAALVCACAGAATAPPPGGGAQRVLFVGNSLTYYNDLPALVQAIADSAGGPRVATVQVAEPNFSLADHLDDGAAVAAIRRGGWSTVVLQQGPSALESSRVELLASTGRLGQEIARVGATPALYAVWPTRDRAQDFARSAESYRLAAESVDGLLLPVGQAWQAAWRLDPTLPLYDADGLHPSADGSYLAALVIYGRLTGRPVAGLPARLRLASGRTFAVDAGRAAVLQAAAEEVLGRPARARGAASR